MKHIPYKLGIKGEQKIHSNSGFLHQSDSILSFSWISKDVHMAQKQPKNGTEKWESYSLWQDNGNSSETNRCLWLSILKFVILILSRWHLQYSNNNAMIWSTWITYIFSICNVLINNWEVFLYQNTKLYVLKKIKINQHMWFKNKGQNFSWNKI